MGQQFRVLTRIRAGEIGTIQRCIGWMHKTLVKGFQFERFVSCHFLQEQYANVNNFLSIILLDKIQNTTKFPTQDPKVIFLCLAVTKFAYILYFFYLMQSEQQRAERILKTILDDNDRKVYAIIKEHPSTKKDLTHRTKFPTNLLDKILKELSSYNLVKSIKRPQSKNMNVWVLANHKQQDQGQVEAQGKEDFMNFIRKKQGSITVTDLQKDAIRKGVKIDHFQQVLNILEMRGQIYQIAGKVVKRETSPLNAPCIECSLRSVCEPDGVISPKTCPYLLAW